MPFQFHRFVLLFCWPVPLSGLDLMSFNHQRWEDFRLDMESYDETLDLLARFNVKSRLAT